MAVWLQSSMKRFSTSCRIRAIHRAFTALRASDEQAIGVSGMFNIFWAGYILRLVRSCVIRAITGMKLVLALARAVEVFTASCSCYHLPSCFSALRSTIAPGVRGELSRFRLGMATLLVAD